MDANLSKTTDRGDTNYVKLPVKYGPIKFLKKIEHDYSAIRCISAHIYPAKTITNLTSSYLQILIRFFQNVLDILFDIGLKSKKFPKLGLVNMLSKNVFDSDESNAFPSKNFTDVQIQNRKCPG